MAFSLSYKYNPNIKGLDKNFITGNCWCFYKIQSFLEDNGFPPITDYDAGGNMDYEMSDEFCENFLMEMKEKTNKLQRLYWLVLSLLIPSKFYHLRKILQFMDLIEKNLSKSF